CLASQQAVCNLSTNVTFRTAGGSTPAFPLSVTGSLALVPGVTKAGTIGVNGETDRFCFAVATPTWFAFQAVSPTFQPCIRVLDVNNAPVLGGQTCGVSSARLDLNLAAGSYFTEIFDNGNNNTGSYTLSAQPIVVTVEATDPNA